MVVVELAQMGNYTTTKTQSNIVFYTSPNSAYLQNPFTIYQLVLIDEGKNRQGLTKIKRLVKLIESGKVQCINDLATSMKPNITWRYTERRPWEK